MPDLAFIQQNAARLFPEKVESLPGIDINAAGQRALVEQLLRFADYHPPTHEADAKTAGARFYSANPFFKELDAFIYHAMLRQCRPGKIIEVGSGFSSALALDVARDFLQPPPEMTFLDPYPERLLGLLGAKKPAGVSIIEKPVQDMDVNFFLQLDAGDFLFIDSSHVSRIGSDVNFLFFDVLPRLKPGVIVHVHDIYWPFEYPKAWLDEGRCWNEAYLLRALLSHSTRYGVLCSSSYIARNHSDLLKRFPRWVVPEWSSSIWLKIAA